MIRVYHPEKNVYDATQDRLKFIFDNFKRVYLSFSGGKDSGVMLNLVIKYMRENNVKTKLGIQILDNEANYQHSLKFMHEMIRDNIDLLDVYWCCMPITLPCTVSSYAVDWQCWGNRDEKMWIRPMPTDDYIVNIKNHKFPFFKEDMSYDEFWDGFGEWYSQGELTANLIGIRASESLNRYRAILNQEKTMYMGKPWTKLNGKTNYNVYPIYDWRTEDIWTVNAKYEFNYNKLYDVFYRAGVPVHKMRVASPFMSESKSSLSLYRVIDPEAWARLHCRVQGANFIATYGKQLNYHSFKLPEGHTWKSFVKFLLETLPKEVAENFRSRFVQSLKYWGRTGRGLDDNVIADLDKNGIKYSINGTTPHGGNQLRRVVIKSPPDDLDVLSCHNSKVTSWKRFAITILKNDHTCKYLGLAPTKEQAQRQREIVEKYKHIGDAK
jgi:predicted phosphoadenosine phosphosulfate sulfurtransferase